MRRIVVALLMVVLMMSAFASSALAYGCDPGRPSSSTDVWAEQRLGASATAYFSALETNIEVDRVFTESGQWTNQYIQMYDANGNYVRLGVNYTNGLSARVFVQAPGVTKYYSLSGTATSVGLQIIRSTSSSYLLYRNGQYIDSILFHEGGWTPKSIKQHVFMSNRGNQVPGHSSNAAHIDTVYVTQYGRAEFVAPVTYVSQNSAGDPTFPGGTMIAGGAWYTYDHC